MSTSAASSARVARGQSENLSGCIIGNNGITNAATYAEDFGRACNIVAKVKSRRKLAAVAEPAEVSAEPSRALCGNQSFEAVPFSGKVTCFDDASSTRVEDRPTEFASSKKEPNGRDAAEVEPFPHRPHAPGARWRPPALRLHERLPGPRRAARVLLRATAVFLGVASAVEGARPASSTSVPPRRFDLRPQTTSLPTTARRPKPTSPRTR